MKIEIKKAMIENLELATKFALLLYDGDIYEDVIEENTRILSDKSQVIFIAYADETAAGFCRCSLRYDYVEGTDGGNVGYLEGIYVLPEFRRSGIAKAFVSRCEDWAKEHGCCEFASDCELDNTDSYNFHMAMGFEEANRIICFAKKL